ncbi:hypothetical protein ACLBXI_20695 [Bacillus cereus]
MNTSEQTMNKFYENEESINRLLKIEFDLLNNLEKQENITADLICMSCNINAFFRNLVYLHYFEIEELDRMAYIHSIQS